MNDPYSDAFRMEEWSLSLDLIEAGDRPTICDKQISKEASVVKLCSQSA